MLAAALWASCFGSAGDRDRAAARNTETYIRIVAGRIVEFRRITGQYPASLAELCDRGLLCGGGRPLVGSYDGWGQPMDYVRVNDGFQVRSLGADARPGTQDDQVFDLSRDRARAREIAGCYQSEQGAFGLSSLFVKLDTTLGTIGSANATYSLVVITLGNQGEAEWYPVGRDSVVLQWVMHRESLRSLRASVQGNTLLVVRDLNEGSRRMITIRRTTCPT